MFITRFRNAALALAGALIVTTTLMTPVAAAAPAVSLTAPASAETRGIQHDFNLSRADIKVQGLNVTGSGGSVTYTFRVTNDGPDPMSFRMRTTSYARPAGSSQMIPTDRTLIGALQKGAHQDVTVTCSTAHICYSAHLFVDHVNGIDTDMTNNLKVLHAAYPH
jgi:hypothetical protein